VSFCFLVYLNIYYWLLTPFTDFDFNWNPDSQLKISTVPPESLAAPFLQRGDRVLAIDGKIVHPTKNIYATPIKPSYKFTIQREKDILTFDIPFSTTPSPFAISFRLPAGILTLIFWLAGSIILYFARSDDTVAIHVGYIFILAAVVIMGIQAALHNVPGAWLVRLLLFFPNVGWVYLGFVPRTTNFPVKAQILFKWLIALATLLNFVAFVEAAFLFPRLLSIEEIVGVSIYDLGFLTGGLGFLSTLLILIYRAMKMPTSLQKQQTRILLLCIGIAILPGVLFSVLPLVLLQTIIIPFPITISLFILIPAAYFFVIYRKGNFRLDIIFSRLIMFVTLAVSMLAVYGFSLATLQNYFGESNSALSAKLLFLPVFVLTTYSSRPINGFIQTIIFGPEALQEQALPNYTSALSSKPELTTLKTIVESISRDFAISYAILALTSEHDNLVPVATVGIDSPKPVHNSSPFLTSLLRSSVKTKDYTNPLFQVYSWAELLLPIVVRNEQIGFLALSAPGAYGFFNAKQTEFLTRITDIISIGSEAIFLFESSRKLSLQLLSAREQERKQFASLIHDQPLQSLTSITYHLRKIATEHQLLPPTAQSLQEHIKTLQDIQTDLRQICAGAYPSIIEQGLELIVRDVTDHFRSIHGLNIDLHVHVTHDDYHLLNVSTAVYRILTESLNNVVKHTKATRVEVEFICTDSELILSISDNGIGNKLSSLSFSELVRRQHIGIVGMFEWARYAQGTLLINPHSPSGTTVILTVSFTKNLNYYDL